MSPCTERFSHLKKPLMLSLAYQSINRFFNCSGIWRNDRSPPKSSRAVLFLFLTIASFPSVLYWKFFLFYHSWDANKILPSQFYPHLSASDSAWTVSSSSGCVGCEFLSVCLGRGGIGLGLMEFHFSGPNRIPIQISKSLSSCADRGMGWLDLCRDLCLHVKQRSLETIQE